MAICLSIVRARSEAQANHNSRERPSCRDEAGAVAFGLSGTTYPAQEYKGAITSPAFRRWGRPWGSITVLAGSTPSAV